MRGTATPQGRWSLSHTTIRDFNIAAAFPVIGGEMQWINCFHGEAAEAPHTGTSK